MVAFTSAALQAAELLASRQTGLEVKVSHDGNGAEWKYLGGTADWAPDYYTNADAESSHLWKGYRGRSGIAIDWANKTLLRWRIGAPGSQTDRNVYYQMIHDINDPAEWESTWTTWISADVYGAYAWIRKDGSFGIMDARSTGFYYRGSCIYANGSYPLSVCPVFGSEDANYDPQLWFLNWVGDAGGQVYWSDLWKIGIGGQADLLFNIFAEQRETIAAYIMPTNSPLQGHGMGGGVITAIQRMRGAPPAGDRSRYIAGEALVEVSWDYLDDPQNEYSEYFTPIRGPQASWKKTRFEYANARFDQHGVCHMVYGEFSEDTDESGSVPLITNDDGGEPLHVPLLYQVSNASGTFGENLLEKFNPDFQEGAVGQVPPPHWEAVSIGGGSLQITEEVSGNRYLEITTGVVSGEGIRSNIRLPGINSYSNVLIRARFKSSTASVGVIFRWYYYDDNGVLIGSTDSAVQTLTRTNLWNLCQAYMPQPGVFPVNASFFSVGIINNSTVCTLNVDDIFLGTDSWHYWAGSSFSHLTEPVWAAPLYDDCYRAITPIWDDQIILSGNGSAWLCKNKVIKDVSDYALRATLETPRDNQDGNGEVLVANPDGVNDFLLNELGSELKVRPGIRLADGSWEFKDYNKWWITKATKQKSEDGSDRILLTLGDVFARLENPFREQISHLGTFNWSDWMGFMGDYAQIHNQIYNYYLTGSGTPKGVSSVIDLYAGQYCFYAGWKGKNVWAHVGTATSPPDQLYYLFFNWIDNNNHYRLAYTWGTHYLAFWARKAGVDSLVCAGTFGHGTWENAELIAAIVGAKVFVYSPDSDDLGNTIVLTGDIPRDAQLGDPGYVGFGPSSADCWFGQFELRPREPSNSDGGLCSQLLAYVGADLLDSDFGLTGHFQSYYGWVEILWGPQTDYATPKDALLPILKSAKVHLAWKTPFFTGFYTIKPHTVWDDSGESVNNWASAAPNFQYDPVDLINRLIAQNIEQEYMISPNVAQVDGNDRAFTALNPIGTSRIRRSIVSYLDQPELAALMDVQARAELEVSLPVVALPTLRMPLLFGIEQGDFLRIEPPNNRGYQLEDASFERHAIGTRMDKDHVYIMDYWYWFHSGVGINDGYAEISNTHVWAGSKSLKLVNLTDTGCQVVHLESFYYPLFEEDEGGVISASARVWGNHGALKIAFYDEDGVWISTVMDNSNDSYMASKWNIVHQVVTVPVGARRAIPILYVTTASTTVWFDDVYIGKTVVVEGIRVEVDQGENPKQEMELTIAPYEKPVEIYY